MTEVAQLHPTIATIDMPERMKALRLNNAGYPVPWFVAWIDGKPDFRVIRPDGIRQALREQRCWVCGKLCIGPTRAFVIGPMCAVNRTTAEPGGHEACAVYSAQACPFLANPSKRRREHGKPEDAVNPGGEMITRNPGVALVYVSRDWTTYEVPNGMLFDLGPPQRVSWWAHGREATRAEVVGSIESGLPILNGMAEQEGPDAVAELHRLVDRAMELVPA